MRALPDTIFFDAAGTLMELTEPVGATYARIAGGFHVTVDASAMEQAFRASWKELPAPSHPPGQPPGDDDRSWWRELVRRSFEKVVPDPIEPAVFEDLFSRLYDHFAQPSAWRLYEDTLPALEALHGKAQLFVLSNFDGRLRNILRGLEIDHYFESFILSSEVGASKPDPRIFQAALAAADSAPERCLHLGDEDKADVSGALAMGIQSIKVSRPEASLRLISEKVLCGEF